MGFLLMSARELQKIEVLAQVLDGSLGTASAAHVLGLSQRQVQRLVRDVRVDGAVALRHKLRGRASNNRISDLKRDYILSLIRSDYPDFGPTLAAEKLAERHGIRVSSESLRQWMMAAGLWQSRTQRRQVHQPRLRREGLGELNIEILRANSSQTKGRVERANRTLQDGLGKELRLAGIGDIEAANAFQPGFIARHNLRFGHPPARP